MVKNKKKKKKKLKKSVKLSILLILILIMALAGKLSYDYTKTLNQKLVPLEEKKDYYVLSDFGLIDERAGHDQNSNSKDDITDIIDAEKDIIKINPKYVSHYYQNGYAPKNEGVCTDVIWYAFNKAGYDLKKLISKDIEKTRKKKTYNISVPDENIDFRRVSNQETFFMRYIESLDTDMYVLGDFMPGDILTFDNSDHIALVGEKYNKNGVPYLVQNRDETQKHKEEDRLEKNEMKVTGHYRFKNSKELEDLVKEVNNKS